MFAMLIFDAGHMTEILWRCSIFEVHHAISFKNMITGQEIVKTQLEVETTFPYPKVAQDTTGECFSSKINELGIIVGRIFQRIRGTAEK